MDFPVLSFPAVILLVFSSVTLLVSQRWRMRIGALGVQYLGVFILVAVSWPSDLAVVKLVAGWMAGAILGISRINLATEEEPDLPSERFFIVSAASLVIITVASLASGALEWVPGMQLGQARGGLLLIGMGLLHLGFSAQGLRVILSLLTMLSGFEVLYAVVEKSTLVAGLLAIVNLGIALAGAYLTLEPGVEESA
jgi:hypothetical protein